jgi:hypothetical protein
MSVYILYIYCIDFVDNMNYNVVVDRECGLSVKAMQLKEKKWNHVRLLLRI